MRKREIWLIGDWQSSAFDAPRQWLETQGACRSLASATKLQRSRDATFVVAAQARPGEVTPEAMAMLRMAAPKARLVVLNGPWCEGEHRPVPWYAGETRVAWRRWREGLEQALADGISPQQAEGEMQDEKSFAAAELERSLQEAARRQWPGRRAAVWTERSAVYSSLADALGVLSIEALWLGGSGRATGEADVVMYDGWRYVLPLPMKPSQRGRRSLATRKTPHKALPTGRLLLLDFPRPDDGLAAADWGIDAMLPLPLRVADLAAALSRLLRLTSMNA
jgi:hypothetical protein